MAEGWARCILVGRWRQLIDCTDAPPQGPVSPSQGSVAVFNQIVSERDVEDAWILYHLFYTAYYGRVLHA